MKQWRHAVQDAMSANILDAYSLLSRLPSLLPPDGGELSSPTDALAALLHTAMSLLDFKLIAVDDNSPSTATEGTSNVLPAHWKSHAPGSYTIKYRHDQSSLQFLLKVAKLAGRTTVNALASEVRISTPKFPPCKCSNVSQTDKIASFDVKTADFSSEAFFPLTPTIGRPLVHGFISSARVTDFVNMFKVQIVQKIIPSLRKEGYEDSSKYVRVSLLCS